MKKVIRLFLVVTFVVFSPLSLLHSSVNDQIQQLTNNSYNDMIPCINDAGDIVWYGPEGVEDWEIFLYERNERTMEKRGTMFPLNSRY